MLLVALVAGCGVDATNLDTVAPPLDAVPDAQAPTVDAGSAADVVEAAAIVAPPPVPECGAMLGGTEICARGMNWVCESECLGQHGDILRELGAAACTTHSNPSFSDVVLTTCVRTCAQCPPSEP